MREFKWNDWNVDHIAKHGMTPEQAEYGVNHPAPGFPRRIDDRKLLARGQTDSGEYIQAIYVIQTDNRVYVIHSRPLTEREKRTVRRRNR